MSKLLDDIQDIYWQRKTCENCHHWKIDHCALYSCGCATAVLNKAELPPRWTSIEEGIAIEETMWYVRRLLKQDRLSLRLP